MTIEGDDQSERFVLPGIRCSLSNDLLMPQMHAVKKTNRQANSAPGVA
jgi:hypothetical protein